MSRPARPGLAKIADLLRNADLSDISPLSLRFPLCLAETSPEPDTAVFSSAFRP